MVFELKGVDEGTLDQLMALWLRTNLQAHGFIEEDYWLANVAFVREVLPQARLFVKEAEGEIVGFLGLKETYIAGVFVREDFQKQGIGKELLNQVKAEMKERSLAVYQKNQGAIQFYLTQGFQIVLEQRDRKTEEMECVLDWKSG